jgi:hypothetical protein
MPEHDAHQPRPSSPGSAGTPGSPGSTQRALAAADALGIDHADLLSLLEGDLPTAHFTRVMGKVSTHAELSAWVIAAKQDRVALRQMGAITAPAALSAKLRELMPESAVATSETTAANLRLVGTDAGASTPATRLRHWNREEVVPLLSRVPKMPRNFWPQARVALAASVGLAACVGLYVAATSIRDSFTNSGSGLAGTQNHSAAANSLTTQPIDGSGALVTNDPTITLEPTDPTANSRLAIADKTGSSTSQARAVYAGAESNPSGSMHAAEAGSHASLASSSNTRSRPLISPFVHNAQKFGSVSGAAPASPAPLAELLSAESLAAALELARDGRLIIRVNPQTDAAETRAALAPLARLRDAARPWKLTTNTSDSLAWLAAPVSPTAPERLASRPARPIITGTFGGSTAIPAAAVQLVMEENARRLIDAAASIALPATVSINLNDAAATGPRQRPVGNILTLDVQPTDDALRAAIRALANTKAGELTLEVLDRPAAAAAPTIRSVLWWDAAPAEWTSRTSIPVVIGPTPNE